MLDFVELETLVTLKRLNSFSQAAKNLHTTQPNVSKRIKNLEDKLGKNLIWRKRGKMELTPDGEIVKDYAMKLLELRDEMLSKVRDSQSLKGSIRIGSSESIVFLLLSKILSIFGKKHPEVDIDLQIETSVKLKKQLFEGEIDLAFMIGQTNRLDYVDFPLVEYEMGWFIHKNLTSETDFWEVIRQHPVLTFSRDTAPFKNVSQGIRQTLNSNYRIHSCASLSALINVTLNKMGVGVFPKEISRREPWKGKLVELAGFPLEPLSYFVSFPETFSGEIIRSLADVSLEAVKESSQKP